MTKNQQDKLEVRLRPDASKILSAVCFVLAEAAKYNQKLTQYQIVKALFFADKEHLNDFGRPITFDNYCAMYHGPVPSFAYDLLKGNVRAVQRVGGSLPWTVRKGEGAALYFTLRKKCDYDVLSSSDRAALSSAVKKIRTLGFSKIRELTHMDPAYSEAWRDEGGACKSYPMKWALLFDRPDPSAAEMLSFLSHHR